MTHLVLVPLPGTTAEMHIARGSGIVSLPLPPARTDLLVYFEGNLYDAVNLRTFEERVQCASGRLATNYPTVAMAGFPRSQFVVVGTYEFSPDFKLHQFRPQDEASVQLIQTWCQ